VEAKWYRDQSADELKATHAKAAEYLRATLSLRFGTQVTPLTDVTFQAIDGGTNKLITDAGTEVHLLATVTGRTAESTFQLALAREANTSVILLNSLAGQIERRPQVLFPGETGRAFHLTPKP
jgi:hypothetical protein